MAMQIPPAVRKLFQVLTGEEWPSANEDQLWALSAAWARAAASVQHELAPAVEAAIRAAQSEFSGKAAKQFAAAMGSYIYESPHYFKSAVDQFQLLAEFLDETALQVEYVKLVSVLSLIELLAEIAWAIANAFFTGGGSMAWLASRYAIFRFLLKSMLGRLTLRLLSQAAMGVLTQTAIDALVQSIQLNEGHRKSWDWGLTAQSGAVGAIGGLVGLPLQGLSKIFEKQLSKILQKVSPRTVPNAAIEEAAAKAAKHAGDLGKLPFPDIAKNVVRTWDSVFGEAAAEGWAHKAGSTVTELVEAAMHEMLTEAFYGLATGQGFQTSVFSGTAGLTEGVGGIAGRKLAHTLGPHEKGLDAELAAAGHSLENLMTEGGGREVSGGSAESWTSAKSESRAAAAGGFEANFARAGSAETTSGVASTAAALGGARVSAEEPAGIPAASAATGPLGRAAQDAGSVASRAAESAGAVSIAGWRAEAPGAPVAGASMRGASTAPSLTPATAGSVEAGSVEAGSVEAGMGGQGVAASVSGASATGVNTAATEPPSAAKGQATGSSGSPRRAVRGQVSSVKLPGGDKRPIAITQEATAVDGEPLTAPAASDRPGAPTAATGTAGSRSANIRPPIAAPTAAPERPAVTGGRPGQDPPQPTFGADTDHVVTLAAVETSFDTLHRRVVGQLPATGPSGRVVLTPEPGVDGALAPLRRHLAASLSRQLGTEVVALVRSRGAKDGVWMSFPATGVAHPLEASAQFPTAATVTSVSTAARAKDLALAGAPAPEQTGAQADGLTDTGGWHHWSATTSALGPQPTAVMRVQHRIDGIGPDVVLNRQSVTAYLLANLDAATGKPSLAAQSGKYIASTARPGLVPVGQVLLTVQVRAGGAILPAASRSAVRDDPGLDRAAGAANRFELWIPAASSPVSGTGHVPGISSAVVTGIRQASSMSSRRGVLVRPQVGVSLAAFVPAVAAPSEAQSDSELTESFGAAVLPRSIKDIERYPDGTVRPNPVWVPLKEIRPEELTANRDAVWLYLVDESGNVMLGSEEGRALLGDTQFSDLLTAMASVPDATVTEQSLTKALNGLGHPGLAVSFTADGRTTEGKARVAGEFRWDKDQGSWTITDKSGRYMTPEVRPDANVPDTARWIGNVAHVFETHIGATVASKLVKIRKPLKVRALGADPAHPDVHVLARRAHIEVAERLPADPSSYTFVAHEGISVDEIERTIRTHRPAEDDRPIRLVICAAAQGGEGSIAAELARRLVTPVLAADQLVFQTVTGTNPKLQGVVTAMAIDADGRVRPALPPSGHWILFRPDAAPQQWGPHLPASLVDGPGAEHPAASPVADSDGLQWQHWSSSAAPSVELSGEQRDWVLGELSADQVEALAEVPEFADLPDPATRLEFLRALAKESDWSSPPFQRLAATVAEHTWGTAVAEFASAHPSLSIEVAASIWQRAAGLVLPLELHPIFADARWAGQRFVNGVRAVADEVARGAADADPAIRLADEQRRRLGLPQRVRGGGHGISPAELIKKARVLLRRDPPGAVTEFVPPAPLGNSGPAEPPVAGPSSVPLQKAEREALDGQPPEETLEDLARQTWAALEALEALDTPAAPPVDPAGPADAGFWYLRTGAAGQMLVHNSSHAVALGGLAGEGTSQYSRERVWVHARKIRDSFVDVEQRDGLWHRIQTEIAKILLPETAGKDKSADLAKEERKRWDALLASGSTFSINGRVVWLRLQVTDLKRIEVPDREVSRFAVGFASTGTSESAGSERGNDLTPLVFFLLNLASSVAASVSAVAAQAVLGASRSKSRALKRTLLTGRKPFIKDFVQFDAGVRFRVFIDGEEILAEQPYTAPARLRIELPAPYVGTSSKPAETPGRGSVGAEGPRESNPLLNAIDLAPVVAKLQANMLAGGLPSDLVTEILKLAGLGSSEGFLAERSVRSRFPHWAGGGDTSNGIVIESALQTKFRGHLRAELECVDRLTYLGDVEVAVREDLGSGTTRAHEAGGSSSFGLGLGYNTAGIGNLADSSAAGNDEGGTTPSLGQVEATALAPIGGVFVERNRATGATLESGHMTHTVLNAPGIQSRYQAKLRVKLALESTTHLVEPAVASVDAELNVPQREARRFESQVNAQNDASERLGRPSTWRLSPDYTMRRQPIPQQPPEHDEPLAAAARRGVGFGHLRVLARADRLQGELRAAIMQYEHSRVGEAAARRSDWTAADRDLQIWFGREALLADPDQALMGIHRTIGVGGREYRVSAKLNWGERLAGPAEKYPLLVNKRAATGSLFAGERGVTTRVRTVLGIGLRVATPQFADGTSLRLSVPTARASYGFSWGHVFRLGAGVKTYRRTETEGQVAERRYAMKLDWTVRPVLSPDFHRSSSLAVVGHLLYPQEHLPAAPVSAEQASTAISVESYETPPSAPEGKTKLKFDTGTQGLYPVFVLLPELAASAASLYRRTHGNLVMNDPATWPEVLRSLGNPTVLAARFDELVRSGGATWELPTRGGMNEAVRIELAAWEEANLGASDEIEVEHYVQALSEAEANKEREHQAGLSVTVGIQARMGSDGQEGHKQEGSGGRVAFLSYAEVSRKYKNADSRAEGRIGITRSTYSGRVHTLRTTPVLEVTHIRWRGDRPPIETSSYVVAQNGMDLLVPDRRMSDLRTTPASEPAAPTEPAGISPVPGITTTSADAAEPAKHAYLASGMLSGIAHAEVMQADAVMNKIRERLHHHGILRDGQGSPQRPNQLLQALEAAYSSEALGSDLSSLLQEGVVRWIPLAKPFGLTRYLWVRVRATRLGEPETRPRGDIKLTLRGESQTANAKEWSHGQEVGVGTDFRARVGKARGHGGVEVGIGYGSARETIREMSSKTVTIYRSTPRDTSVEFQHPIAFQIELGTTTEVPLVWHGLRAMFRAVRSFAYYAIDGRWPEKPRCYEWHEATSDLAVHGTARLLVPRHQTIESDTGQGVIDLDRALGSAGVRHARPERLPAPPSVGEGLLKHLHPISIPAAAAIRKWGTAVAFPTADGVAPVDQLGRHSPSGPDFATSDRLAYQHFTSGEMFRTRINELLGYKYKVPLSAGDLIIGLKFTKANPLGRADGIPVKQRKYEQREEEPKYETSEAAGWQVTAGPEAGGHLPDDHQVIGRVPIGMLSREAEKTRGSSMGDTDERNKEGVRNFRYYSFDVEAVIRSPKWERVVTVEDGFYGMLPLNRNGGLAGGLDALLSELEVAPTAPMPPTAPEQEPVPVPAQEPPEAEAVREPPPAGPQGVMTSAQRVGE